MVAHSTILTGRLQPQPAVFCPADCPAKTMPPGQRQGLALRALTGTETISGLAAQHQVSRKFVYQQVGTAQEALHEAFAAEPEEAAKVLFYLPVTGPWLEQVFLGLTLICHSSLRGVTEFCRDVLDHPVAVGTVQKVLQATVERARTHNRQQDLSAVRIGAHDEIFQNGQPVLVGADVDSTYCYLLNLEDHRDGDTWGLRLLELQDQGFHPEATIADAGKGLRAGQALAMPDKPCRGDVFHALQLLQPLVTYLENRAYQAIATRTGLEKTKAQRQRRGERTQGLALQIRRARQAEAQAIDVAADVALLADWLRRDILSLAGPDHAARGALYDFVVAELRSRQSLCPHRIGPVVRALAHQRHDLLAFAAQLDCDLAALSAEFQLPLATVREVFNNEVLDVENPLRWAREAALRDQLGERFFPLSMAVAEVAQQTVRASSVIENLNSRLRCYFFLRRHLGPDYLALLQFFLNHRRFLRSERPERVGKSPAELLTGEAHPHWLEMLGYVRLSRN